MANQFIFFCGGSGARAAEAYAYCAAMGLMGCDNNVRIVLCDPDTQNGNVQRALGALKMYKDIRNGIYGNAGGANSGDIFCTPITTAELWNVDCRTPEDRTAKYKLSDLADNGNSSKMVIKALFSQDEAEKDFTDVGFHAHPNLGSAVVQAAILREEDIANAENIKSTYKSLKQEMKNCLLKNHDVHVFFVGSLFGGTGASCMPTIASDLRTVMSEYLQKNRELNSKVIIGACMLLPYFTIPMDPNDADQLVKPEAFRPNASMALSYYNNHNTRIFDVIYPLSLPHPYTQPGKKPHFGSTDQKDPLSLVEWSAAAACLHFVNNVRNVGGDITLYCGYLEEENGGRIVLNDNSFMMSQFGPAFVRWMNFVSFYTLYLHPNIQLAQNRKSFPNWYGNHVNGKDVELDPIITNFCLTYYDALYETLGKTLDDENARPANALVDSTKWDEFRPFLEKRDWKAKDVKAAQSLMNQKGFKLVKQIHQNHCDASRLIKSLFTSNAGNGALGNMLQIVNSALK